MTKVITTGYYSRRKKSVHIFSVMAIPIVPIAIFLLLFAISISRLSASEMSLQLPPEIINKDPDPKTERLCAEAADPDAAPDKIHIHCRMEHGNFAPPPDVKSIASKKTIKVVAYNMERGMNIEKQIALMQTNPDFFNADVLLLSELDRGCSRTSYRNIVRDFANALGMNYVFGVEYIELPRKASKPVNNNETICEHGNAILTKQPMKNIEEIRFEKTENWYIPPGSERANKEPRLGGCMAIAADILFGEKSVRVYSTHFDNGSIGGNEIQAGSAREIVAHAAAAKGPVVVGGDLNTLSYYNDLKSNYRSDLATGVFIDAGYTDAHSILPLNNRMTTGGEYGIRLVIDLIFVKGAAIESSGLCRTTECKKLSDHKPLWTNIKLD